MSRRGSSVNDQPLVPARRFDSRLTGGAIWSVYPLAGGWPLLLCLLPWMLRLVVGYFPFRQTVFDPALFVFAVTAAGGVWAAYNREAGWSKFWIIPVELANHLPGLPHGSSRLELARGALDLIADFPFTGGGLGAFAGLYSQYVMVIPHFLFNYSHNFYLDVALEQGLLGLLAFVVVILGSAWLLVKSIYLSPGTNNSHSISTAVLASLLVVILHGLVDDALYGNQATPQLFLLPGMAITATRPEGGLNRVHTLRSDLSKALTTGWENRTRWIGAALVSVVALIAPLIIFREPITAA